MQCILHNVVFTLSHKQIQTVVYFINSKFDLETSYITYPDCPDHVVVLDGINSWSDRLKTLCGGQSDWGEEIVSSGDGMRVEFTTDSDYSASGFIAKYSTSLVQNGKFMEFFLLLMTVLFII